MAIETVICFHRNIDYSYFLYTVFTELLRAMARQKQKRKENERMANETLGGQRFYTPVEGMEGVGAALVPHASVSMDQRRPEQDVYKRQPFL